MLNGEEDPSKKGEIESEPPETRTRNLLIKSHGPRLNRRAAKGGISSSSAKRSLGYYFVYYLVSPGITRFVGKMLAKLLVLLGSIED